MANHASHASLPYPIKNARFTVQVPYLDADGDPTDPTTPDTEISQDGGAFADAAEEMTTVTGSNGMGYITLTGAETNNSMVGLAAKVASGPKATLGTFYPRNLAVVGSGTLSAGSAGGGTLGTLLAYDVTGCFIRTTGGTGGGGTGGANNQARRIITYNTSTGAFTVSPNWETTPDATTTYDVLLPEGVTLGMLRTLNPTTAGRTLDVSSGGEAGVDWANVGSPTTTLNLSGTTISTSQGVASVTGAVGSVTGNVGGNVTGSVGSVATGGISASSFAVGAVDANALAADAAQEIRAAVTGGAYPLDTDANGRVRIVDGTATGELDTTSGKVDVNDKTGFRLSATGVDDVWDEPLAAHTTADTPGSVLNMLTQDAVTLSTDVALDSIIGQMLDAGTSWSYDRTTDSLEILGAATAPSAATIADAVWDEAISGHLTAGSTGNALNAAGSAGDPWSTSLPGAYGAGTAGKIIGDNINATISSRAAASTFTGITSLAEWLGLIAGKQVGNTTARTELRATGAGSGTYDETADSQEAIRDRGDNAWTTATGFSTHSAADVWAAATRTLTALGFDLAAGDFAAGAIDANALATDAVQEIRNAITGGSYALDTDVNGRIRIVDGTGVGELDTASGLVSLAPSQTFTTTGAVGSVTGNVGGNVTGSVGSLATQAKADVNAEVLDVMATDTRAEPGQGTPPATLSAFSRLDYLYKFLRNKIESTSSQISIYNDAGTVIDQKASQSDDNTTYQRGKFTTGA